MKPTAKILLSLLCTCCVLPAFSQGKMSVSPGAHITTDSDAYLVLNNMDYDHNGNFIQTVGDGTLKLTGNLPILISGSRPIALDKLEVEMGSSTVTATLSIPV